MKITRVSCVNVLFFYKSHKFFVNLVVGLSFWQTYICEVSTVVKIGGLLTQISRVWFPSPADLNLNNSRIWKYTDREPFKSFFKFIIFHISHNFVLISYNIQLWVIAHEVYVNIYKGVFGFFNRSLISPWRPINKPRRKVG
jgi:hypothetical protein